MTDIAPFLRHDLVAPLAWSLLHFLWQGLAIATALAIALRLLRRVNPQVRYAIACAALAIMAACPLVTCTRLASNASTVPRPRDAVATHLEAPLVGHVTTHMVDPANDTASTFQEPFAAPARATGSPIDRWLPWIVTAWLGGVLVLLARLLAGWLHIVHMRRHSRALSDPHWQSVMERLARSLRVLLPVRLCEAAWVEVPTVIGWLRPVILLPPAALVGLNPDQLQAILAHELAHVRRHDYLVNFLQTVVETLLFYHPAVWWVSYCIRSEREDCCDDLAVRVTGSRRVYAAALATMEGLRGPQPIWGLAATGGSLLHRVRRLAGRHDGVARSPAWWVIALTLLVLAAGLGVLRLRVVHAAPPTRHFEEPQDAAGWGPELGGLRTRLVLLTEKPAVGTPLKVRLEVKNFGKTARQYDPQVAYAFRVISIAKPDGTAEPYIGPMYSTASDTETLEPGQTGVLFGDYDLAGEYLLIEPGRYVIRTRAAKERVLASIPESNALEVRLEPGSVPDLKRLFLRMRDAVAKGWEVSLFDRTISFVKMGRSKMDSVAMQLHFSDEPLKEPGGDELPEFVRHELGKGPMGRAYLTAPRKVKELWPDYVERVAEVLGSQTAKPQTSAAPSGAPLDKGPAVDLPWIVRGRVTDGDGQPLPDVEVRAHCGIGSLRMTGRGSTGAGGFYEFRFGPGVLFSNDNVSQLQAATISVHKPGYFEKNLHRQGDRLGARSLEGIEFPVWGKSDAGAVFLPGEAKQIDFVLLPAARARGRLFTPGGEPAVGYRVSLTGAELPPSSSALAAGGRTDEQGRFEFRDIPTGYEYQILIEPPKAEPPWLAWASPPLAFEDPGERAITATFRNSRIAAKQFEIHLAGPGVNWREALAGAAKVPLGIRLSDERDVRVDSGITYLEADLIGLEIRAPGPDQSDE